MATANDLGTLNGLFKETYADKMLRLIPEGTKLLQKIPFIAKDRQPGNNYHQPVVLGLEHGVTFADSGEGAFNLVSPVAGQIKDATVRGYQLVLRSVLSYVAASRATGSGPRAFEDATKFLVGNMLSSVSKKLEIELLYGQIGYGTVGSLAGNVITVTTAEWAPGIWSGAEHMPIEIRSAAGALRGTATVISVDLSLRTVTVDMMPMGVLANDVIWHAGAYLKEFAGMHKIFTNTGSLFGIDAAYYNLWKANTFTPATTSLLSFAIIQQAIALGVGKGLDNDVMLLINPGHWDDLLTEQAAFRMYDSSYSSSEVQNGGRSIKFYAQNGAVEIVPSIYVKEGYAYIISLEDFVRVGSTDVTFKRPGQGDNFFRDMEDSAGYELRCYTDQALFCSKPGKNVLINNLMTET
jgi:hypothetical protein